MHGPGQISPFEPLLAVVRIDGDQSRITKTLEFHEIKAGELIAQVELGWSERLPGPPDDIFNKGLQGNPSLQIAKDKVVYRDGTRLHVCPISAEVRKKALLPLVLKIPKLPVATVEKPVEVQFATYDPQDRPTYSLTKDYDGLSIDAKSGRVTFDLPKIWKGYLADGPKLAKVNAMSVPRIAPRDTAAIFERLTGTRLAPDRTAFKLPLCVAVTNAGGETDELRLALIVTASKAEVDKVTSEREAAAAKVRDEMIRAAAGTKAAPGNGDRVTELENRVRRLEASLDAVLQKLDRMENEQKRDKKPDGSAPWPEQKQPEP